MAMGTGSGLAHAAIDRVFSSKHPEPQEAQQAAQQIAAAPSVRAAAACALLLLHLQLPIASSKCCRCSLHQ